MAVKVVIDAESVLCVALEISATKFMAAVLEMSAPLSVPERVIASATVLVMIAE